MPLGHASRAWRQNGRRCTAIWAVNSLVGAQKLFFRR
jgi:hypothetical protein